MAPSFRRAGSSVDEAAGDEEPDQCGQGAAMSPMSRSLSSAVLTVSSSSSTDSVLRARARRTRRSRPSSAWRCAAWRRSGVFSSELMAGRASRTPVTDAGSGRGLTLAVRCDGHVRRVPRRRLSKACFGACEPHRHPATSWSLAEIGVDRPALDSLPPCLDSPNSTSARSGCSRPAPRPAAHHPPGGRGGGRARRAGPVRRGDGRPGVLLHRGRHGHGAPQGRQGRRPSAPASISASCRCSTASPARPRSCRRRP